MEERSRADSEDRTEDGKDANTTASGADEDESHAASQTVFEEDSHAEDGSMATSVQADGEGDGDGDGDNDEEEEDEKKETATTPKKTKKRMNIPAASRRGRAPAVKGLTIPFRTVKKAMKLDPDIPIVQNEAAIMTTMAAELFLRSLAKESHQIAKSRGRNTIRYEDVAEARSNDASLAFLHTLLP
eukprot:Nitzschia sp. Nitz4//scaffold232_size35869//25820//26671//NITZ4_007811-RA/size35869-snap-gene-0.47-mRNA-1//1//CDS//3329543342//6319//frame0